MFDEYWKVFDNNVWVWIIITLIFLIVGIVRRSGGNVFLARLWSGSKLLCLIKVLVEQGDPFPAILTKSFRFRFVIGATLLAGVVLSNAYKSTNVYNIVKPRYIVTYHEVGKVMRDNFSMHVRVSSLKYYIDSKVYFDRILFNKYLKIKKETLIGWVRLQTGTGHQDEILAFVETFNSKVHFPYPRKGTGTLEYNQTIQMIHTGKFHPVIQKLIVETVKVLEPLKKIGYRGIPNAKNKKQRNRWSEAFNQYLQNRQQGVILRNLQECPESSAWLLPDYVAKHYFRILSSKKSYSHVGRRSFLPINLNFFMEGLVPIHIVKRFLTAPTC